MWTRLRKRSDRRRRNREMHALVGNTDSRASIPADTSSDTTAPVAQFVFPDFYSHSGRLWISKKYITTCTPRWLSGGRASQVLVDSQGASLVVNASAIMAVPSGLGGRAPKYIDACHLEPHLPFPVATAAKSIIASKRAELGLGSPSTSSATVSSPVVTDDAPVGVVSDASTAATTAVETRGVAPNAPDTSVADPVTNATATTRGAIQQSVAPRPPAALKQLSIATVMRPTSWGQFFFSHF